MRVLAIWLALGASILIESPATAVSKPNLAWVVGAQAAINSGKEPLAPIVMDYIANAGKANPNLTANDLLKMGHDLISYMRESDIPQREKNFSSLLKLVPEWGEYASTANDMFYDNYLQDDAVGVWNQVTGYSKQVASRPGFWENISSEAQDDPQRVGAAIQSLSQSWFDLRNDDSLTQVAARYPAVSSDRKIDDLLERANQAGADGKALQKGLEREIGNISREIDAANAEARQQGAKIDSIYSWVDEQRRIAQAQARSDAIKKRFANYQAGLSILQTLAAMGGGSQDLQRGIAGANAIADFTEQWAFYAASGGSAIVLTSSAVSTYAKLIPAGICVDSLWGIPRPLKF